MEEKVLIAGATGYLGNYLVKESYKQGYKVYALARDPAKLDHLKRYISQIVVAKVTLPSSIDGICKNMDYVISSIGITKQKEGFSYWDVDYQGNYNLLKEAAKANVKKFVYISVFNAHKLNNLKGIQAKLAFTEVLKESSIEYTIFEPNGFFADIISYLDMAKQGRAWLLGKGDFKINPIHGADLAKACVKHLKSDEKIIQIGGPQIFTHKEIVKMAFKAAGKKVRTFYIPLWFMKAIVWSMRKLTPEGFYGPLEFFISVLSQNMVAPTKGIYRLSSFFEENIK